MTEDQIKHHIMQPCCVRNFLPKAITQAPRNALSFYTYGDVTMEKFYQAVSHLIDAPHVMVLSMPVVSPSTVAYLQLCFERGWITNLVLSTSRDATTLIDKYLADYRSHVLYACTKDISHQSAHMVLYSNHKALTLTGPMLEAAFTTQLCAYTLIFHATFALNSPSLECGNPLFNILYADIAIHRGAWVKSKQKGSDHPLSSTLQNFLEMNLPPYDQD